jgi:hypothetical protein
MKKLQRIAAVLAVLLSMFMCIDDSISLFLNIDTIETPVQSDCNDVTHHHHFTLTDHFFQKNLVSYSNTEFATGVHLFLINQPIADQFLSSIWQPPQKTC